VTRVTLTITDRVADQIRSVISHPQEAAGVLLVGLSDAPGELRLLARDFVPSPEASYTERTAKYLRLDSSAWMPALKRAALLGPGTAALFVHSHPQDPPVLSPADKEVDESLRLVFQTRLGTPTYGSLVVRLEGEFLAFSGSVWRDDESIGPIELVRFIGRRIVFQSAVDSPDPGPPPEIFDRQVQAFGPDFQRLVGRLHIGVVGAGGTGSAVGEQLVRLGVGAITVIDDQRIEASNVTRVYGTGLSDVGRLKTDAFADNARRIGVATVVRPIAGRITEIEAARALRSCDVVFGCTDDLAGRAILSRLAFWYLIPVFDMGFLIDGRDGVIRGLEGRVTTMLPGTACLQCLQVLDPAALSAEQLPPEERLVRIAEGYAPGLNHRDPAVIPYTTMVAAWAISELIERIVGFGDRGPSEARLRLHNRKVSTSSTPPSDPNHFCASPDQWGAGDQEPFLGRVLWA
jgi:molybdopterin/thiamine biosynthesis adenylyltransferase